MLEPPLADIDDATTPHVAVFGITARKTTLLWLAWWLDGCTAACLLVATLKADDFSGF